jgi:hypothetical protein
MIAVAAGTTIKSSVEWVEPRRERDLHISIIRQSINSHERGAGPRPRSVAVER